MKEYIKSLSSKQLRILIIVAIFAMFALSYFLGNILFNDKRGKIEESNVELETQYNNLLAKVAQENEYQNTIQQCNETMDQIKQKYGPGFDPTVGIRFAIDLGDYAKILTTNVMFGEETDIFSSTEVPSADGTGLYAYKSKMTIDYTSTYEGIKSINKFIQDNPERMNVDSFSANFDSDSGNLMGSVVINCYSMTGTEKQFKEPEFYGVLIGTKNPFGTAEVPIVLPNTGKKGK